MMIRKIVLTDFVSFYGRQTLRFDKGMNYIIGLGGSGKTNMARALQFALLGYSDLPKKNLINTAKNA
jgi:chromosome segregation ATPase